jgi:hypothetical protein
MCLPFLGGRQLCGCRHERDHAHAVTALIIFCLSSESGRNVARCEGQLGASALSRSRDSPLRRARSVGVVTSVTDRIKGRLS